MKFTQEVKDKWLEALESGKYVHGTGRLSGTKKDIQYHCCLGVLCDLFPKELPHNNTNVLTDGKEDGYNPIIKMIGGENTSLLYQKNDCSKDGYKSVIPLIKELKTVE